MHTIGSMGVPAYHTCSFFLAASLFGCLDDLLGDDSAMRGGDATLVELARHTFLDQVSQPQADLGNFGCRDGRLHLLMGIIG